MSTGSSVKRLPQTTDTGEGAQFNSQATRRMRVHGARQHELCPLVISHCIAASDTRLPTTCTSARQPVILVSMFHTWSGPGLCSLANSFSDLKKT